MRKYEKFRGRVTKAGNLLLEIAKRNPTLFAHWKIGMIGAVA
jgi:hypothetical protein